MSKHTPGPWKAEDLNNMGGAIVTAGSREVARTWGYDMADMAANARLIAAAPEMLDALKAAQSRLCEHCPGYRDDLGQIGDHTDECLAAINAIAKAEGRS